MKIRPRHFSQCLFERSTRTRRGVIIVALVLWGRAGLFSQSSTQTSGGQAVSNPAGVAPGYAQEQGRWMKRIAPSKPAPADIALSAYIERVRGDYRIDPPTTGSLWIVNGRLTHLSTDLKARNLHDVISVVVSESLSASTDGTVKNSRASNMSSAISSLFGSLAVNNRLQNLFNQTSSSGLNAQGQSVSNSNLATTLGGEVVEVLPNGMLVIQAVRQVTFSQQTQTIRLRGVVRPEDVSALNQVPSTAITNLELEVAGKGIINDYTYRPNFIVRLFQRLLVF
ncbi:flagellar basal body L-ring protein FlgH [Acidisarcina polymorpha]|uniref:flagellar basal body L-ring protein FlgH n=1 Tax=Acidisarcina polymorpha TaxID=2211140 RepID=UPI001F2FE48C|nr:flagellar basal body L-ring protein FlgH [Acidisarcina polymorpha]